MNTPRAEKPPPVLSKRRVGLAGIAAIFACAACCTIPLLAAAGLGSGVLGRLTAIFRPGFELLIGATVFVVALGGMALRGRFKRRTGAGCGASRSSDGSSDGSCCDRRASSD